MTASFQIPRAVEALLSRGVVIPCPASVEVGEDVNPARIAPGVVIHTGSRLRGARTSIGPGCEIGGEAPATIEDCQLGRDVALKGGSFSGATFLDRSSMGSAAHIRPGTLLEEEASGAHAVGLKQTVFFPFVTAGSLINFCDGLMAGGSSRKDHSEIGSSYIHFNFTPHGDKATASLIGDVPRGVMLDRPAVFLGGQGGLVGPARLGFGTVIPAGFVCREDVLDDGLLLRPEPREGVRKPYKPGRFGDLRRPVANCLVYLGNLRALEAWYRLVRAPFMENDPYQRACYEGALGQLGLIVDERIRRLQEVAGKMPQSLELLRAEGRGKNAEVAETQERFAKDWPLLESALRVSPADDAMAAQRAVLLREIEAAAGGDYLAAIKALSREARSAGTTWLQAIVDSVASLWPARPQGG